MKRLFFMLVLASILAACATAPERPPVHESLIYHEQCGLMIPALTPFMRIVPPLLRSDSAKDLGEVRLLSQEEMDRGVRENGLLRFMSREDFELVLRKDGQGQVNRIYRLEMREYLNGTTSIRVGKRADGMFFAQVAVNGQNCGIWQVFPKERTRI